MGAFIYIVAFLGLYWGFFTFFHGIVKERADNRVIVHFTGFVLIFIQIFGTCLIYDRVLEPLKDGYRWPNIQYPIYVFGVAYVILFILACRAGSTERAREFAREILDRDQLCSIIRVMIWRVIPKEGPGTETAPTRRVALIRALSSLDFTLWYNDEPSLSTKLQRFSVLKSMLYEENYGAFTVEECGKVWHVILKQVPNVN